MVSESFTNDGASGTANIPVNGSAGTTSASSAAIAVVYDASTQRYTITAGSRSQSFGAADRDATLSNGKINVYVRKSGNTTDSLTLTRPGTSGSLNYRYVGGGFWQRTVQGATAVSGSVDAFAYGVETSDVSLPRTGQGAFTTDMLGVMATPFSLDSFVGHGVLAAKFNNGVLSLSGHYQTVNSVDGSVSVELPYSGTGMIGSTKNEFTASFDIFPLTVSVKGRFYGPGADELGGVIIGSGSNYSIEGVLLGRRAGAGGDGLESLVGPHQYDNFTGFQHYPNFQVEARSYDMAGAGNLVGPSTGFQGLGTDQLIVDNTAGTYSFLQTNSPIIDFTEANRIGADSQYIVYRKSSVGMLSELYVSTPGSGNSKIALTYTSFGMLIDQDTTGGSAGRRDERYFVYGLRTDPTIFPTTGSASYSGVLNGSAGSTTGQNNYYLVSGNFGMNVNFASNTFTGTLTPILQDQNNLHSVTLAGMPMTGSLFSTSGSAYQGGFTSLGTSSNNNSFIGNFFGPTASEVGGTFAGYVVNPEDMDETIVMQGTAAGKKN